METNRYRSSATNLILPGLNILLFPSPGVGEFLRFSVIPFPEVVFFLICDRGRNPGIFSDQIQYILAR